MAPQKPHANIQAPAPATKLPKPSTGARVAKYQHNKVGFLDNGLLNIKRKTGKFLKIARQNQRDSPLLRMPAEIRNQIYGYARWKDNRA
ncbi:hypothetical protein EJ02DRAFT_420638 [Clathrospora elynae]|uniref:Uncharacterized protein n=1 Tax=Clathrospora elynae TaxID=706981 RepID=A0A6A5SW69_9PLEO|nr:hypothetical protein EJ02DRAFT_420638 [Clathrospora elynae]